MISIVIPAHNEAKVIRRCLENVCRGAQEGELEVIVACNGCEDDTASVARSFGAPVRVVELEEAGKWRALNAGDREATGFPRFYLDADIVLEMPAVRRVAQVLQVGQALAAAPRMEVDFRGCPWTVRYFYEVWLALPYCRSGMIGSGVYALSEAGRSRFGEFPPITADDGYARLHFGAEERQTVETCSFLLIPPRNLRGIVKVKTRAHFGALELHRLYPALSKNEEADHGSALVSLLRDVRKWPAVGVYVLVRLMARALCWRKLYFGGVRWERDDTSRDWVAESSDE